MGCDGALDRALYRRGLYGSKEIVTQPYLILTGIPRSGTTLTASLMNALEGTICLHEPFQFRKFCLKSRDRADFVERCLSAFTQLRNSLLDGQPVMDGRKPDGSYPTNYFD